MLLMQFFSIFYYILPFDEHNTIFKSRLLSSIFWKFHVLGYIFILFGCFTNFFHAYFLDKRAYVSFSLFSFSSWNPRDSDPLINLMETWKPLLPQWIMDNIFNKLIMPKLLIEVNTWNPLTDTTPIHIWIHPWIPLLGEFSIILFLYCPKEIHVSFLFLQTPDCRPRYTPWFKKN